LQRQLSLRVTPAKSSRRLMSIVAPMSPTTQHDEDSPYRRRKSMLLVRPGNRKEIYIHSIACRLLDRRNLFWTGGGANPASGEIVAARHYEPRRISEAISCCLAAPQASWTSDGRHRDRLRRPCIQRLLNRIHIVECPLFAAELGLRCSV
jgi:hypothetical protein